MPQILQAVRDGAVSIGPGCPLLLVAGLCIVEDEEATLRHAEGLRQAVRGLPLTAVFKCSFDKANRSSLQSYRGPGIEKGLAILSRVREATGLSLLTDVHEPDQCVPAAEVVQMLQIPAFLCRQTDLLTSAARTGRIINVKKGQFMAPWDMKPTLEKVRAAGNQKVTVTERGVSFGYNTLVTDFRALPILRGLGAPVIFDASHSVQQPGGLGDKSGGEREMIPYLARAAAAVGIDGLFCEFHEDPQKALSDGPNSLYLRDLRPLLEDVLAIRSALGQNP